MSFSKGHEMPIADDTALLDVTVLAARSLIGIAARSVAEVEDQVTLPQLRVLVLVADRGTLNLNSLAREMGVHPSNATRACDRLVVTGLLQRRESPDDRRQLVLELTDRGRELVESVVARRRHAIAEVLERVPERRRRSLGSAMSIFANSAGEAPAEDAWRLGWPN